LATYVKPDAALPAPPFRRCALPYFRRYIRSGPPDAADVQTLIDEIEYGMAMQRMADKQAEAERVAAENAAQATQAQIELAEILQATATTLSSRPTAVGRPAGYYGGGEYSTEELLAAKSGENIYDEQVVSASRQVTSPLDAPVSTHIITEDDIRMSGATDIPTLLRSVPGIGVMQMGTGNYNLGIRGFNERMARKVLVLVDGRSVYMDFIGPTYWKTLSFNLSDVERVEIIRGPGSTMYGANAFSGVINIITKPVGERDASFDFIAGMGETLMGSGRYSDRIGNVGYSMSAGFEQTDRFELEYDEGREDVTVNVNDPTLGVRMLRGNAGINWLPRRDTQIGVSGGLAHGYVDWYAIGLLRNFYVKGTNSWLRADMRHKGISARAFWNNMAYPDAGPIFTVPGQIDMSTNNRSNVVDVEMSYNTTATVLVPHNISLGGGYRYKDINGFEKGTHYSFIDGNHTENHLKGFIEDRITFFEGGAKFDSLSAVLGFRFDQHPLVGFTPSPRVAVVAKPTSGTAIRASVGTAFRIPTFMESYLDIRVPGPVTGAELISFGDVDLEPELIRSVELGFRFEESDYFMFDVAAYYQRVNNLIQLGDATMTPDWGLDDENQNMMVAGTSGYENVDQAFSGFGVEPAVHVFPVDGLDVSVNYAFNYLIDLDLYADDPGNARDDRCPLHKFNASVQYRSPFALDFGISVNAVSKYAIPERTFDEAGLVIVDPLEMDPYLILNARINARIIEDKLSIGIMGFNLTAFGPDGGHKEHDFGTTIGPRLYGSLNAKF